MNRSQQQNNKCRQCELWALWIQLTRITHINSHHKQHFRCGRLDTWSFFINAISTTFWRSNGEWRWMGNKNAIYLLHQVDRSSSAFVIISTMNICENWVGKPRVKSVQGCENVLWSKSEASEVESVYVTPDSVQQSLDNFLARAATHRVWARNK